MNRTRSLLRTMTVGVVASALMLASGARVQGGQGAEDAIRAADQAWTRVFGAKNLEQSVAACTPTAVVLAPNAPKATGREAIRQLFAGFFALPNLKIGWQPDDVRVAGSGDLGYSTGHYAMSFNDASGKVVEDRGKYVTIWERQRNGSWKVAVDIFNSDLPAAPASGQ